MHFIQSNLFKFICLFVSACLLSLIVAFLSNSSPGEISQTLSTILVGLIATVAVSWQIYTASMQSKADHETALKFNLYKEIANKVRLCAAPIMEFGSIHTEYELDMNLNEQTAGRVLPKIRYEAISTKWKLKCIAVSEIRGLIEDWIVVEPRLDFFKLAINSADHDVENQYKIYMDRVMTSLPRDIKNADGTFNIYWKTLETGTRSDLLTISDKLHYDCLTLLAYTLDFRDQMQMSLLKPLFPNSRIAPRKPKDPKLVVLDVARADELETYFLTQTEFGRKLVEQEL
jgi:hypothetical protein